jgi:hypothetical protein
MLGYHDREPLSAIGTTFDAGAVGDKITLPIPMGKWKLEEAWVQFSGPDTGSVCAIEFAWRPAAGTNASRSAACGSAALTLIKPTAVQTGKMLYKRAAADFFVQGGGEIVVSVSVSATTTTIQFFGCGVTLRESPEDPANMTTAAGGGGLIKSA